MLYPWLSVAILTAAGAAAGAAAAEPVSQASTPAPWSVGPEWNARLRHEQVEDDALARDASATTLRVRAGLRFHLDHGFTALLEGEGIVNAGDNYNSGANGRIDRPAVIDPEGAEFNQAWLGWKGRQAGITAGRQRVLFDNQRW